MRSGSRYMMQTLINDDATSPQHNVQRHQLEHGSTLDICILYTGPSWMSVYYTRVCSGYLYIIHGSVVDTTVAFTVAAPEKMKYLQCCQIVKL